MNGPCDVCDSIHGSHRFDVLDDSGGIPVNTCDRCTRRAIRLATAVKEDHCLWCWQETSHKYEWFEYARPDGAKHAICSECRYRITFTDKPLASGPGGGVNE